MAVAVASAVAAASGSPADSRYWAVSVAVAATVEVAVSEFPADTHSRAAALVVAAVSELQDCQESLACCRYSADESTAADKCLEDEFPAAACSEDDSLVACKLACYQDLVGSQRAGEAEALRSLEADNPNSRRIQVCPCKELDVADTNNSVAGILRAILPRLRGCNRRRVPNPIPIQTVRNRRGRNRSLGDPLFQHLQESTAADRWRRRQVWASTDQMQLLLGFIANLEPRLIPKKGGMTLLSPREQEVACLVAEGLSNQDIANQLKLREHTIRNYLFHIFEKLGLSSRVELTLYALSQPETERAKDAS